MKLVNVKLGWLVAAMSLVITTGGTALADDTELFIAGEDNSALDTDARPNILFIIDTSGSMGSNVSTQVPWDSNQTFSGCYLSNAVYYSFTSQAPGCSTNKYFYKTENKCQAAVSALNELGEYSGNALAWRQRNNANRSRWVKLTDNNRDRDVECQADAGVHGNSSGTYYAADGSAGPWSGNANSQPSWVYNYRFFNGNYLNWLSTGGTVNKERIEVVQEVTNALLDNLTGVNVGLMRFNLSEGGPVTYAMENIATARNGMKTAVNNLNANGWTPLSETLYEAGQYFGGRSVDYGVWSAAASRVGGVSTSTVYNSPIDFACQKNYIIFLTDGEPTQDTGAENRIENLPGFSAATGSSSCSRMPGESSNDGKCLDEMAGYLRNHDMSDLYGPQNVTTYTIGFTVDLPLLKETAKRGGGDYYLADNTATLASALTKITVSILDDASTFTAPSVPVNAFNRTQNLDDIFVSVFNPSSTVHWPGNVKKYKLVSGRFVDANQQLAVDPNTGFFKDSAQSYWSVAPDGDRPPAGGAAQEIPDYVNRNVYTNIAGGDLNSVANHVRVTNLGITGPMLGGSGSLTVGADGLTERERMIQWMRGLDVFDADDDGSRIDTRHQMGDPLHVRPAPVIYGGTAGNPDMTIFVSTNDGYLHAINPTDGSELWSFIPTRLLSRTQTFYQDETSATRVYGLDGEITATILNNDKVGGIAGAERVILTFGMRRGGDSIFAVEVTDRNDPQLLWEINSNTAGFGDLGQTWSTPQASKVRVGGAVRDVLFFAGGYDPGQDADNYQVDSQGNAVYMVDIETGALIWSAGKSGHDLDLAAMDHSIPAPLRVADLNGDGLASRLYFGDMGGRVWRIDIINGNEADELGKGGVLASVGGAALGSPTAADLRRFYNQADVADVFHNGKRFMAVNIGSGYRAHPLDRAINEVFFSVRDYDVLIVPENTAYTTPALFDDLVDITGQPAINMDSDARGWRLTMNASGGEKVLGRSITYNGTIFFSSFAPGSGANACTAVAGQNRLYAISLFNGHTNLDDDEPYIDLKQGGIAPQVELLYVPEDHDDDGKEEGKLIALIGTEDLDLGFLDPIFRTYWTQDGAQ